MGFLVKSVLWQIEINPIVELKDDRQLSHHICNQHNPHAWLYTCPPAILNCLIKIFQKISAKYNYNLQVFTLTLVKSRHMRIMFAFVWPLVTLSFCIASLSVQEALYKFDVLSLVVVVFIVFEYL